MMRRFSDLPAFRRDQLAFLTAKGRAADRVTPLRVGWYPVYLLSDPQLVREVLRADEADIDKGRLIYKLREILGTSSLTISGPEHRERRSVIHKTLAAGVAGEYVPQIAAIIRRGLVQAGARRDFDAHDLTGGLTLDVISAILFGPGVLSAGDGAAVREAVRLVEDDLAEGLFRLLPDLPWVRARKKRKLAQGRYVMSSVVDRARRKATSGSLLRSLEAMGLAGDVLRDEVLLMLLAGHHTTGSAATWLLYHIAADPVLARRLADEAVSTTDRSGELTPKAVRAAALSRSLVYEVLRLYPSTHWLSREIKRDMDVGGVPMRRGTSVLIAPWHLHRDPRYWPEPSELRLDRDWMSNLAYMPFGFGGRACVGMALGTLEMQILALEFALAYEAEVLSAVPPPAPHPSITLVPPPITLRLRERIKTSSGVGAAA